MATSASKTVGFGSGQDPAMVEANQLYQEALAKLSQSLDTRKNRFFDPVWLAAAQGFGAPTQTGGFGESLGNAAKSISAAQEQEIKNEQEIAQQRVAAAGKGVELQRMRSQDASIADWLGGSQPAPSKLPPQAGPLSVPVPREPAAPDVATAAPVSAPSALSGGALPAIPGQALKGALSGDSEGDGGVQIFPPNPSFMSAKDYVRLNRNSGKPLGELLKEGQDLERKNLEVKESGTTNLASGKFYPNKAAPVDIQIFGEGYEGKTFTVPESVALELSMLQRQGNAAGYKALADKFTGKSFTGNAPTSKEDKAIAAEESKTRAVDLAKAGAAKEAGAEERYVAARSINGSANRVLGYLKESANFFGTFARPGVVAAVGNLIKEGIQTPSGTLNLGGLEESVRKLMPKVTQKALDDVTKAAIELAEIELTFTRLYLSGQGQVTEGERKIVRAIPGTVSNSPEVLRSRMELLKARSEYDMNVVDAFRQWQEKNPGRSYLEFERKSDLYKDIKKNFDTDLEKIFSNIKAVPTSQRARPATGNQKLDDAKKRLEEKLKGS